jgi:hypothetical protein
LKAEGVSYVVAPYEADAQLAFLESQGMVDGIITEDSDLLVFGCRNVLFKLDLDGGCVNIRRKNFGDVKDINLMGWNDSQFREMAVGHLSLSRIPTLTQMSDAFGLRLPGINKRPRDKNCQQVASKVQNS